MRESEIEREVGSVDAVGVSVPLQHMHYVYTTMLRNSIQLLQYRPTDGCSLLLFFAAFILLFF